MVVAKAHKKTGLKKGDRIVKINGYPAVDIFDYNYATLGDTLELAVERGADKYTIKVNSDLRISFLDDGLKPKTCKNNCIFCFINQLPKDKNLRPSLFVKDDDYRLSLINGTYITLTNLAQWEIERIIRLKFSPLYISVHSTDKEIRSRMLNQENADIMPLLKRLKNGGIKIHAQIVYCPGVNEDYEKSTRELFEVASSLAIVPVGLTKDKNPEIKAVTKQDAKKVIATVEKLQTEFLSLGDTRFVWAADEFYLLANRELPEASTYENYPQIENGVGLFAQFSEGLETAIQNNSQSFFGKFENLIPLPLGRGGSGVVTDGVGNKKKVFKKNITLVTGTSAYNFIKSCVQKIAPLTNNKTEVVRVTNLFFGDSVTVSGLLTGSDILAALRGKELGSLVLIPASMLKENTDKFLDNLTVKELSKALKTKVKVLPVCGEEFFRRLTE